MSDENIEKLMEQVSSEKERIESLKSVTTTEELTPEVKQTEEVDPYLEEAVKMGYKPDYDGPNKKSAKRFVEDKSFFDKIAAQNKKIDELIEFNKRTIAQAEKAEKIAYERALQDIANKKLEAVDMADKQAYLLAEQEEARLRQVSIPQEAPKQPDEHPDVVAFKTRHAEWLNSGDDESKKMRAFVAGKAAELNALDPNYDPALAVRQIEEELKERFSHKFDNDNRKGVALVSETTVSEGKVKTLSDRLTTEQKNYIKKARQYGSKMTDEQYAKRLEMIGELK